MLYSKFAALGVYLTYVSILVTNLRCVVILIGDKAENLCFTRYILNGTFLTLYLPKKRGAARRNINFCINGP